MHREKKRKQPYHLHPFLRAQKAEALHNLGSFPDSVSIFFKVHDTQQEAERFKLLWHHTLFQRGAVNVDEYRTDQVLHTFVFKVWQCQSNAQLGLMINISKSLWDSAVA